MLVKTNRLKAINGSTSNPAAANKTCSSGVRSLSFFPTDPP